MKKISMLIGIVMIISILLSFTGCSGKSASIQYLGHSSFVVADSSNCTLGIDLWSKDAFKYSEDLPTDIGFSNNNKVENIIKTHSHQDHSYSPPGINILRDVDDKKPYSLGKMLLYKYKTEHYPKGVNGDNVHNGSILVETNGVRILHLGDAFGTMSDTNMLKELKKQVGSIDILMVPIGNYECKPTNYDSVKNTLDILAPHVTIPVHYWSVADKDAFLKRITSEGYSVVNIDTNLQPISKKDISKQSERTIWNIKPGPFVRQ